MYTKDLLPGDIIFYGKNKDFKHVEIISEHNKLSNSYTTYAGVNVFSGVKESLHLADSQITVYRCKNKEKVKEVLKIAKKWIENGLTFSNKLANQYLERRFRNIILASKEIFDLNERKLNFIFKQVSLFRVGYDKYEDCTFLSYNKSGKSKRVVIVPGNYLQKIHSKAAYIGYQQNQQDFEKLKFNLLKTAARRELLPSISKEEDSMKNGTLCNVFIIQLFQTAYLQDYVNTTKKWVSDKKGKIKENYPDFYKQYLKELGCDESTNVKAGLDFWDGEEVFEEGTIDKILPKGLQLHPKTSTPKILEYALSQDKENFECLGELSFDPYLEVDNDLLEEKLNELTLLDIYRKKIGKEKREEILEGIKGKNKCAQ